MTSQVIHADGDANVDGDVDGTDFLHWQRDNGIGLLVAAKSVPEPISCGCSCSAPSCSACACAEISDKHRRSFCASASSGICTFRLSTATRRVIDVFRAHIIHASLIIFTIAPALGLTRSIEFRTIDGAGNNLASPNQGRANFPLVRLHDVIVNYLTGER